MKNLSIFKINFIWVFAFISILCFIGDAFAMDSQLPKMRSPSTELDDGQLDDIRTLLRELETQKKAEKLAELKRKMQIVLEKKMDKEIDDLSKEEKKKDKEYNGMKEAIVDGVKGGIEDLKKSLRKHVAAVTRFGVKNGFVALAGFTLVRYIAPWVLEYMADSVWARWAALGMH